MDARSVEILVGDTPETAVVHELATRQVEVMKQDFSECKLLRVSSGADVSIVHKYGVEPSREARCIFIFHFDPYDFRHNIPLHDLERYLKKFQLIICINQKQKFFCDKRGLPSVVVPHGSGFVKEDLSSERKQKERCVIALVCRFYGGNVKGEKYFFELANILSEEVEFQVIGSNWCTEKIRNEKVGLLRPKSYEELKKYFKNVDILFVGSRYEAGPASFPDAVNIGQYVIGTPVGMLLDNFIEGESGFYLTFDIDKDVESIRQLVERISNGVTPKYHYFYPSWNDQIKNIVGML